LGAACAAQCSRTVDGSTSSAAALLLATALDCASAQPASLPCWAHQVTLASASARAHSTTPSSWLCAARRPAAHRTPLLLQPGSRSSCVRDTGSSSCQSAANAAAWTWAWAAAKLLAISASAGPSPTPLLLLLPQPLLLLPPLLLLLQPVVAPLPLQPLLLMMMSPGVTAMPAAPVVGGCSERSRA
jgi:hypothetical protein